MAFGVTSQVGIKQGVIMRESGCIEGQVPQREMLAQVKRKSGWDNSLLISILGGLAWMG